MHFYHLWFNRGKAKLTQYSFEMNALCMPGIPKCKQLDVRAILIPLIYLSGKSQDRMKARKYVSPACALQ